MLIEKIFKGKYSTAILKKIISNPDGSGISGLSKDLGISKSVVFKSINSLVDENILITSMSGKRKFYRLNVENYFVRELIKRMFELEEEVVNKIKGVLVRKLRSIGALSVILYGSFLTPRFDFKSDIDLIMIVKNKRRVKNGVTKITKFFSDMGLAVFFDVIEVSEFKRLYKIREPLITNVIKNGVVLKGKHPIELV